MPDASRQPAPGAAGRVRRLLPRSAGPARAAAPRDRLHRPVQRGQVEPAERADGPAGAGAGQRHAGQDHAAERLPAAGLLPGGPAGLRLRPGGQGGPGRVPAADHPVPAASARRSPGWCGCSMCGTTPRRTTWRSRSSWSRAAGRCWPCSPRRDKLDRARPRTARARELAAALGSPEDQVQLTSSQVPAQGIAELGESILATVGGDR